MTTSDASELTAKLFSVAVTDGELDTSILVVGGGAWGTSTALELARRGYSDVTVIDPFPVPSPISAGTDNNKIMSGGESIRKS
jgi:glycine/D-amino acid oxidase-like deaminating enzyme